MLVECTSAARQAVAQVDELGSFLKTIVAGCAIFAFAITMGAISLWRNLWEQDVAASEVEVSEVRWHGSVPTIKVSAVIRNNSAKAISDFDVIVEGYDCPSRYPADQGWGPCYFVAGDENTLGASIPAHRSYRYDASFALRPNSEVQGKFHVNVRFANFEGN